MKETITIEKEVYEAVLRNSLRVNEFEEENKQLKELLKECREVAEFTKTIVNKHKWFNEVITKIDEVLNVAED